jgi:hypothetical protein
VPETIYKLQPDRTVHLRGFDHLGASAAIHSADASGFRVTGNFRDASDFAVVTLYDADNFFEHPSLKYLPDFDFDGLRLTFDVAYEGLMPLNCSKYPTIDWPYLDAVLESGGTARIRLSDHAEVIANPDQSAAARFEIVGDALQAYDRLTLWYQNMAFDYIVPGKVGAEYSFWAGTPTTIHGIIVGTRAYTYTEQAGDSSALVAARLVEQMGDDPDVIASIGSDEWVVRLTAKRDTGETTDVSVTGYLTEQLHHIKATTVCRELAAQINGADYVAAKAPFLLAATAEGTLLTVSTVGGGYDANFITMYATWKTETLRSANRTAKFAGGLSTAVLRVSVDFTQLGLGAVRQMWLTLAPRLADGKDYLGEKWSATFSNWTVTGPEETKWLRVAAEGSVRIGSVDGRCAYSDGWEMEEGFYFEGCARVSRSAGRTVEFSYACPQEHDLWLGTSLFGDGGAVRVEVDGVDRGAVWAILASGAPVVTRRKAAAKLPAGEHMVKLTTLDSKPFCFDFGEAVVEGDWADPAAPAPFATPALDYSTDHSYKLPPSRILWMLGKLGYTGPLNEYLGIFWWNERKRVGGVVTEVRLQFDGEFEGGDRVFVEIGGQASGRTVFPGDTPELLANHFAYLINATYVGVWALADGAALVVRARSASDDFLYEVKARVERAGASSGTVSGGGRMTPGSMGVWEVDTRSASALNSGAQAWHADLYRLCAASGRKAMTSISMELVNPPQELAARYADGAAVITDMGFGGLRSTHCAFGAAMLEFHQKVFGEVADLMSGAGLQPELQCGEFTWWYFTNRSSTNPEGGMAYYDAETMEAAQSALGRPLHVFRASDDDPDVNGGADAAFLRQRLRDYAGALVAEVRGRFPGVLFEILFPYDVNHPTPEGIHHLGGRLNRFLNFPLEWGYKVQSGFDRIKVEALDYGVWSRNLDLARRCLQFPMELGWPAESVRAMIAVFRGGYPWWREVEYASELGMEAVHLWAFDHVCLYGWGSWTRGSGRACRQG